MASVTTMEPAHSQDRKCRLCLENFITNETRACMDILDSNDVQKLLREVYEVQVLPDDPNTTMLCIPCYQQLINDYKFRMKLFTLRKTFKLNQTMLIAQIIAFKGTSEHVSNCDGKRFASMRENSTQTEPPQEQNSCPPISTQPVANGPEENNMVPQERITEPNTTAIRIQQLIPVLVDCRKQSLYLEALHPLQVSMNPHDPAPLAFMCSTCYKTFEVKEEWKQHKEAMDCVPSCRYCLSEQTADHCCPNQSEFSAINKHIVGSTKYVTTYATMNLTTEDNADEPDADADVIANDGPKKKQAKLDANHNGRDSSAEPHLGQSHPTQGETNETRPLLNVDTVINLSSSEDEPRLVIVETKPAAKSSSKKKKKKKRFF